MSNTQQLIQQDFFEKLGFYKISPNQIYKLPLPTTGTYLIATNEGYLWIEYGEDYGEDLKQSVAIGKFNEQDILSLINILLKVI